MLASSGIMLDVRDLSKVYVTPASGGPGGGVRQASFSLEKGAFFTLLGPSGCGKTTTLRCIAGLEQPDQGFIRVGEDVMFDGDSGIEVPLNRRQFGMVFQSYAIWPHMTVFENVAFPLRVAKDRKFSSVEIKRLVEQALDTVSLSGFGNRPATRMSGGQQQRIALARAIVRQPRLLLLDEPLSNLDAKLREEMRNELRRLQQQIGVTTIYVTHDQAEALEMSDLIAVMRDGRIVQMGTPREIYFRPADAFVAEFVGASNWLHGRLVEILSGDLAKVRLANGTEIIATARQAGVPRELKVAVRPEAIRLAEPKCPSDGKANQLLGRVVFAGFMGNISRFQVDVGGTIVQAYDSPTARYSVGDTVLLRFDYHDAGVFG